MIEGKEGEGGRLGVKRVVVTVLFKALSNVSLPQIQRAFQYGVEKMAVFKISPCLLELVKRPFLVINYALKQKASLFFCSPCAAERL